ncbi:MAG TPA: Yip1 family protein [Bacteroidota bacterium]|nr:Yip1 family protein [Bacteroidota bacterium]
MNIVDRAKNIILTPKTEWPAIAAEQANVGQIITGYVIPLALIPALALIIGWGVIGQGIIVSFTWGLAIAIETFIGALVGVFVSAWVVDILAPNFASEKNFGRSVQLIAYSYTPAWIAGVLNIVPLLGTLATIASLYGLYLLYLGVPVLKKTPQDKVVVYLIVSIVVVIVVSVILAAVLTPIVLGIFGLSALSMLGRP